MLGSCFCVLPMCLRTQQKLGQVRARRQHQLPRPPPLRASTFLQQVDGAGATGTDYDGDVRSGELLPPPFDRASTISSHPWSRPAVATSSLSATGGSGADTGFDAGAGWGNIIDDLHTTPNAFGYGSAGMDASSSSSAPTSSGISSDATMVRGGSGGARHSQHHTNSAALSETASSHSRKRRAPSSPTSAPSAAAAAAAAAVVAAASVHSPTSGPNDGDRAPALLPNLSALYNTNRAHVSTSGMSVGGETDGAGDRGSSGDHASSGLAWHALGAAASRVGSSATNGSGSSYDTAGLPPPPRETGHRRMLPSALEPDHYYSSQLPVVHPRYMVGQTMNTSAGTRVGRSSSSGVGGGASSGGYNLSVDTQSPTMASPYAMHSSSFVTGNLQASGEENRGLGDARVTDSISAMRRAQAVAAGGDIGGDLGAAGWRQQPARAEQRRCVFARVRVCDLVFLSVVPRHSFLPKFRCGVCGSSLRFLVALAQRCFCSGKCFSSNYSHCSVHASPRFIHSRVAVNILAVGPAICVGLSCVSCSHFMLCLSVSNLLFFVLGSRYASPLGKTIGDSVFIYAVVLCVPGDISLQGVRGFLCGQAP